MASGPHLQIRLEDEIEEIIEEVIPDEQAFE